MLDNSTTPYALPRLFYSPSHSNHMDCVELSLSGSALVPVYADKAHWAEAAAVPISFPELALLLSLSGSSGQG